MTERTLILIVNTGGGADNLSRAMTAGRLRVVTTTPAAMPKNLAGLTTYRGVILENVPATQVGPVTLEAITHYAADLGGGVLLTGGTASFGVGGVLQVGLDPFLPVSMELQNEHRKLSLAMAVALDRSGSMAGRRPTDARRWIWRTTARARRSRPSGRSTKSV